VRSTALLDVIAAPPSVDSPRLALIEVEYEAGAPETYALPLAFATGDAAERVRQTLPQAVVSDLETAAGTGVVYGAEHDPGFATTLLETIRRGQCLEGDRGGRMVARATDAFPALDGADALPPSLLSGEQSNSSIRFGDRLILKLFRKLERGPNPDLEVSAFLTERAGFRNVPALCGSIEYLPREGGTLAISILQAFVPSEGDAWRHALGAVARYFEAVRAQGPAASAPPLPRGSLVELARNGLPPAVTRLLAGYGEAASLLGRRTAELHRALASSGDDPAFAPEAFTLEDQRSLRASLGGLCDEALGLLAARAAELPADSRSLADAVLRREPDVRSRFDRILARPLTGQRTRTHGDYHLGQLLWTGRDFFILDFEGEPARPLAERRAKRSPLRDVAGMLRSFHYAAHQGIDDLRAAAGARPAPASEWAEIWWLAATCAFLGSYSRAAEGAPYLPREEEEFAELLALHLLEKAVYELIYELNNRPAWVALPLRGIAQILDRT
jgi:trehalose synthase-fused probable maltokinase